MRLELEGESIATSCIHLRAEPTYTHPCTYHATQPSFFPTVGIWYILNASTSSSGATKPDVTPCQFGVMGRKMAGPFPSVVELFRSIHGV